MWITIKNNTIDEKQIKLIKNYFTKFDITNEFSSNILETKKEIKKRLVRMKQLYLEFINKVEAGSIHDINEWIFNEYKQYLEKDFLKNTNINRIITWEELGRQVQQIYNENSNLIENETKDSLINECYTNLMDFNYDPIRDKWNRSLIEDFMVTTFKEYYVLNKNINNTEIDLVDDHYKDDYDNENINKISIIVDKKSLLIEKQIDISLLYYLKDEEFLLSIRLYNENKEFNDKIKKVLLPLKDKQLTTKIIKDSNELLKDENTEVLYIKDINKATKIIEKFMKDQNLVILTQNIEDEVFKENNEYLNDSILEIDKLILELDKMIKNITKYNIDYNDIKENSLLKELGLNLNTIINWILSDLDNNDIKKIEFYAWTEWNNIFSNMAVNKYTTIYLDQSIPKQEIIKTILIHLSFLMLYYIIECLLNNKVLENEKIYNIFSYDPDLSILLKNSNDKNIVSYVID